MNVNNLNDTEDQVEFVDFFSQLEVETTKTVDPEKNPNESPYFCQTKTDLLELNIDFNDFNGSQYDLKSAATVCKSHQESY